MASSQLNWVIYFANSIIGVGLLAIPFCFHKCGIILTALLIIVTNFCAKATCDFLLKAAQNTRTIGFEKVAFVVMGPLGKLITELSTIGLLLGTLVAFQVVLGDLAPTIVHNIFGIEETWGLRAILMCLSCAAVLPLSLMRNISSLAGMNTISMMFYFFFVILVGILSLSKLFSSHWWHQVNFWQPAGFFHCLPIISLSYSCQTQVFVMYEALPEPSANAMNSIIDKAINLVSTLYLSVGIFGYIAFYDVGIRGDILANFPSGLMTDSVKAGFWLSVVISFPLILFPVRLAIYSLLFGRRKNTDVIASAGDYIPPPHFTGITVVLIAATLVVGITVPRVETVLSVTGACIGTFLCFVAPSALYLGSSEGKDKSRLVAKVILVFSIFCMVASTVTVLSGAASSDGAHTSVNVAGEKLNVLKPVEKPVPSLISPRQLGKDQLHERVSTLHAVLLGTDNVISEKERKPVNRDGRASAPVGKGPVSDSLPHVLPSSLLRRGALQINETPEETEVPLTSQQGASVGVVGSSSHVTPVDKEGKKLGAGEPEVSESNLQDKELSRKVRRDNGKTKLPVIKQIKRTSVGFGTMIKAREVPRNAESKASQGTAGKRKKAKPIDA